MRTLFLAFTRRSLGVGWLLLLPALVTAQTTCLCCKKVASGQAAFDKGDYVTAVKRWTEGTQLSDAAQCPDLPGLVKKAQDKKTAADRTARQREQEEARANQEREKQVAMYLAADDSFWEALKDGDAADCDKYLQKYPNGRHAAEARRRKESLAPKTPATKPTDEASSAAPAGMAFVKGGDYTMGDLFGEGESNETQHAVTVSDFYLGKYEVTVAEFKAFVDETGYQTDAEKGDGSYIWNSKWSSTTAGINWRHDVAGKLLPTSEHHHPVIHVSWNDATAYCEWLSKKSDKKYRLPTEAEWEYAARATSLPTGEGRGGAKVRFGNGKDIADPAQINFDGSAVYKKDYSVAGEHRRKTIEVGSLNSPNALGLHDMSGNVWEWCSDWYAAYPAAAQTDPTGPTKGTLRVLRGGSWSDAPRNCRAAYRHCNGPRSRHYRIGFRVALAASFR